jgi:hypothetical protein
VALRLHGPLAARTQQLALREVANDPIIAQRLADTGQVLSVLGPAEFTAGVQEQRDKLASSPEPWASRRRNRGRS